MEHPFLVEEFTPEHATHIGFASANRFVTAEPQPSARHIHKTLKANRPVQRRLSDSAFTTVGEMIDSASAGTSLRYFAKWPSIAGDSS